MKLLERWLTSQRPSNNEQSWRDLPFRGEGSRLTQTRKNDIVQSRVSAFSPLFISSNMIIDHTTNAFHLRPFTKRKRLSATQCGIGRQWT